MRTREEGSQAGLLFFSRWKEAGSLLMSAAKASSLSPIPMVYGRRATAGGERWEECGSAERALERKTKNETCGGAAYRSVGAHCCAQADLEEGGAALAAGRKRRRLVAVAAVAGLHDIPHDEGAGVRGGGGGKERGEAVCWRQTLVYAYAFRRMQHGAEKEREGAGEGGRGKSDQRKRSSAADKGRKRITVV